MEALPDGSKEVAFSVAIREVGTVAAALGTSTEEKVRAQLEDVLCAGTSECLVEVPSLSLV